MISYFTRLNYNFANKYYLTASFRGDTSSLFGHENRWGYFPSISAAWTISMKIFIKLLLVIVQLLKMSKLGYGGNNNISGIINMLQ